MKKIMSKKLQRGSAREAPWPGGGGRGDGGGGGGALWRREEGRVADLRQRPLLGLAPPLHRARGLGGGAHGHGHGGQTHT